MTIWNPSALPYERFVKQQAKGISNIATLFELLTYIRLAKSTHEAHFIEELIKLLPDNAIQYDYEVELAVMIGKEARYVSVDKALDYVFGYFIWIIFWWIPIKQIK